MLDLCLIVATEPVLTAQLAEVAEVAEIAKVAEKLDLVFVAAVPVAAGFLVLQLQLALQICYLYF